MPLDVILGFREDGEDIPDRVDIFIMTMRENEDIASALAVLNYCQYLLRSMVIIFFY